MTRKLLSWALCVILLFGITGCFGKRNQNGADAEEVVPLNVYMVAPEMTGAQSYIFTPYSMGDYTALLSAYGEEGYRYKNILENFEKDYPAELNITYFRFTDELDAQLEKDLKAGTLPDVVIEDSLSEVDAYRWFEADLFLDLMPYVEKDGLYTSGEYYNEVLRAGIYKEQQLIMPLSFNMNTIMTSEESLSRHIVNLDDNNLSELLAQFTDVAEKMRIEGENQEVLAQNCSRMTDFTIVILLSAAGEEYIDYETKTVNLNQKWFETMAVFYKSFALQEAKDADSLLNEEEEFDLSDTWHDERVFSDKDFEFFNTTTLAYIEGGSCYNSEPHSFTSQANYYESQYTDVKETFILKGLPTYQNASEYTAMVYTFAGVMSTTKYPDQAYMFVKYLMDQPSFMHLELSTNRAAAQSMLDKLTSTEFTVSKFNGYLESGLTLDSDTSAYVMKPMTEATKNQINNMIERISYTTLPNWPVYNIIKQNMEEYVAGNAELEECYEKAVLELEAYAAEIYQPQ